MLYRADFHIHSCLSPCASLEMSPSAIVEQARLAGLNALALSDHNCAFNLPAFDACCRQAGIECLLGMEVTSVEEAHMLCLFDQLDAAMEFGDAIYTSLPEVRNQPERFGDQPIVAEDEEILGFADKYLISASTFDISTLVDMVHALGGLFVPAHIDRAVFGIISQLGFLPEEDFDAVELTPRGDLSLAGRYPVMRNSDSHQLDSVGSGYTEFDLPCLSVAALKEALKSSGNLP
ncbi:MAG: PHP domain-containing protein [Pontiellaceae bacterium]|nr:PHP domain-containing protein [Pontiellaceae bacterium]MBN2784250.1 PHP domain-containing protein [Pontiellaceae bacterium]